MSVLSTGLAKTLAATSFSIDNSLRFNDDDSAYLSRTPSSAGNRKTWTFSAWVKLGNLITNVAGVLSTGGGSYFGLGWSNSPANALILFDYSGGFSWQLKTTQVFRDTSAWYHIVVEFDTTIASPSGTNQRVKLWVNGTQITDFATETYPSVNYESHINNTVQQQLGREESTTKYVDQYYAEVHFIDGQALTPSSFGEEDTDYKHWKPIEVTGLTYGTNGFYLDFKTSGTLGNDANGSNNWTSNNLASTDQMLDTPTNNFCTYNALDKAPGVTLSEGNLTGSQGASTWTNSTWRATQASKTGKWYYEVCIPTWNNYHLIGVIDTTTVLTNETYNTESTAWFYQVDGRTHNGTQINATLPDLSSGDIVQVAYDLDAGKIWWGVNNTWLLSGNPSSGANPVYSNLSGTLAPGSQLYSSSTGHIANFGQDSSFAGNKTSGSTNANDGTYGDFYYTPPTDFLALCTNNLPEPAVKPQENFDVDLWSGTGATNARTTGFQPDFVWIAQRSDARGRTVFDSLRGATVKLDSSSTAAEDTHSDSLVSFDSTGYTLGADTINHGVNYGSNTHVGWAWKAGGAPTVDNSASAGATPTAGSVKIDGVNLGSALAGSIAATRLSANQDAGFSIVSYTGNGTAGATIGHGLSTTPDLYVIKRRGASGNWPLYHTDTGNTKFVKLAETDATTTASWFTNNTSPTTSVFSVGNDGFVNSSSATYIAYCFHSVEGYSKVGSYTGNGSTDGTFVYCGFRPAYVLYKISGPQVGEWELFDTGRDTYNEMTKSMRVNRVAVEYSDASVRVDFVSNGFKFRAVNSYNSNASGQTYIYLAISEIPFKYSTAR